jgi:hypothetical protein
MDDRMAFEPVQSARRSHWTTPVCARLPTPPALPVVKRYLPGCRGEHKRPGDQVTSVRVRKVLQRGRTLSNCHISTVLDEPTELGVRHRMLVDPEVADLDVTDRMLLGIEIPGALDQHTGRDPCHIDEI